MFSQYKAGRTPNPDVLCNREIKFDLFLKQALSLGADFIATGHYAIKEAFINEKGGEIYRLIKGKDPLKDQTYFLSQLNQYQLSKSLFPLGRLTKKQVREIALNADLVTAKKKDSQGLCFIGKVHLPDFLKQKLPPSQGEVVEIPKDSPIYKKEELPLHVNKQEILRILSEKKIYSRGDGQVIGPHQGAHYFTKGQRKGLHIGGHKEGLFVLDTDVKENILYVGMGKDHPGLYRKALFISQKEVHWVREDRRLKEGEQMPVSACIRYRQPLQRALIHSFRVGVYVEFEELQEAISEGQFVVWYIGNELIGSGVIS